MTADDPTDPQGTTPAAPSDDAIGPPPEDPGVLLRKSDLAGRFSATKPQSPLVATPSDDASGRPPEDPGVFLRESDLAGRFSATKPVGPLGDGPGPGDGIVRGASWATAAFVVAAVAAAAAPDLFGAPALVLDVVLFLAGCVIFVLAFLRAAERSRTDAIGIGGLFFLAGDVAPADVRRRLIGALAVQVVVGLATAAVRPYTNLAAGTLVPVLGLGLCGLWAARYGRFGPRASPRSGPRRS